MGFTGRTLAFTGTVAGLGRDAVKQKILASGARYTVNVGSGVDVLVVGDKPLQSKVDQARAHGAEVLAWADFLAASAQETDDREVPLDTVKIEDLPLSVQIGEGTVRILDLTLPRVKPGPLSPDPKSFGHYTLDGPTLRMLRFVARAVRLSQPCLLEGDTATSKTSAITWLAAVTGHQVVRVNLNGQTDTSELVGRYVPNEHGPAVVAEELLAHLDLLEDESRTILLRARDAGRELTGVERAQIAANERMSTPAWRFQEGLVPRAMREGWWLILDELNLAEPQVLERLNPVLEREPTLVLTEGPGTRFGRNGDVEVHPRFRVFATMNPAEYQGRSLLSPAFRDRWVSSWQAQSPGELEYRQMLERLVFGKQPEVDVDGPWRGPAEAEAPFASLAKVPGIGDLLGRIAALHAALVSLASPTEGKAAALGGGRRERYVFSRRGLLGLLDALSVLTIHDPVAGTEKTIHDAHEAIVLDALERTYLDRIRGEADRGRVVQAMRSLGLHRSSWMK